MCMHVCVCVGVCGCVDGGGGGGGGGASPVTRAAGTELRFRLRSFWCFFSWLHLFSACVMRMLSPRS